MANTRRTRAYRGAGKRTSGSSSLMDTVRSTLTQVTGNRGRGSRGRSSRGGGGGFASQASGFIGGLLSGGDKANSRSRSRGRRRR